VIGYLVDWQQLPVNTWVTLYETPSGWTDADRRAGTDLPAFGEYFVTEVGAAHVRTNWYEGEQQESVLRLRAEFEITARGIA